MQNLLHDNCCQKGILLRCLQKTMISLIISSRCWSSGTPVSERALLWTGWSYLFNSSDLKHRIKIKNLLVSYLLSVLWNRNYFLRFRFRFWLLKSYGSGSYFWQVTVPVPIPIPAPYLDHKKQFKKKCLNFFGLFYIVSWFTRKKFINFNKFFENVKEKMLNEGNQIHNFISSSGSEL